LTKNDPTDTQKAPARSPALAFFILSSVFKEPQVLSGTRLPWEVLVPVGSGVDRRRTG
jgi:hypothetical protein